MDIRNVGPSEDDPGISQLPDDTELVVYWYEAGSYEGSGTAYALAKSKWFEKDLGHCSCYGPWEPEAGEWNQLTEADLRMRMGPEACKEVQACAKIILPMLTPLVSDESASGND